jgi:hypothetical protein
MPATDRIPTSPAAACLPACALAAGYVGPEEVFAFFVKVYAFLGKHRTPAAVRSQVDALFSMLDGDRNGLLSLPEFLNLAAETKFSVGQTLTEWIDTVTERFVENVEPVAAELRQGKGHGHQQRQGH